MKETQILDALGKPCDVAEVKPVPRADLDGVDGRESLSWWLRAAMEGGFLTA
jgi:hypothetical protein